jgi:hypothetical protein
MPIYASESMKIKLMVIMISTMSSDSMSFLKSTLSMRGPISGARMTAGSIDIIAVREIVTASAPRANSIEKIAT